MIFIMIILQTINMQYNTLSLACHSIIQFNNFKSRMNDFTKVICIIIPWDEFKLRMNNLTRVIDKVVQ